jgi:SAM-dependent methyltransferase
MTVPYDNFAKIYDRWITSGGPVMDACRDFYLPLLCKADGPVVELGVGNGRILVEAAKRGKKQCIGVDYSKGMLELCRKRAGAAGVESSVRLLEGDLRDVRLPEPAALITIPYDSIGHAVTDAEKLACFKNAFKQLIAGGELVLDQQIYTREMLERYDRSVRLRDVFVDPELGREVILFHTTLQNIPERRWRSFLWLEMADDTGLVTRRSLGSVENSWIDPKDMRRLLLEAGFQIESQFGNYEGAAFGEGSSHQIWVARRPS